MSRFGRSFPPSTRLRPPPTGIIIWPGAANLTAQSGLAAAPTVTTSGAAALTAQSGLTATPTPIVGSANPTAQSGLTADGTIVHPASAALTAQSGLTAPAPSVVIGGSAALTAQAGLGAGGSVAFNPAAALTALSSLTATSTYLATGAAALTAQSGLTPGAKWTTSGAANLASQAGLFATVGRPPLAITSVAGAAAGSNTVMATTGTAQVGDLLAVWHTADIGAASDLLTPTATGVTWTLRATADRGAGTVHGKWWTGVVTVNGTQTVTGHCNISEATTLSVYVISGWNTATPVVDAQTGTGTGTVHALPSVTTSARNALLLAGISTHPYTGYSYYPPELIQDSTQFFFFAHLGITGHQALPVPGSTGSRSLTASTPSDYATGEIVVAGYAMQQVAIGQVVETDAVLPVHRGKTVELGQVVEADAVLRVPPGKAWPVHTVVETDTPLPLVIRLGTSLVVQLRPVVELDTPMPVPPVLLRRRKAAAIAEPGPPDFRIIAQRYTGEWLDWDLPVNDLKLAQTLSGPFHVSGVIAPKVARLVDSYGRAVLDEWSTWLHVELDDRAIASCILKPPMKRGDGSLEIEADGFSDYLHGTFYRGTFEKTDEDVFDVVRELWNSTQSIPGFNLGVAVSSNMSGQLLGTETEKVSETKDGVTTEVEKKKPYKLNWWDATDCGATVNTLAKATPFDYVERTEWNTSRTDVLRFLDLYYPRIGRKRDDLRFATDENITKTPILEESTDYADYGVGIGKGDGSAAVHVESAARRSDRLARMFAVTDKSIADKAVMEQLLTSELGRRRDPVGFTEITVNSRHPNAPLGSFQVGDDILVRAFVDWAGEVAIWHRITKILYTQKDDTVLLSLARSDSFTYRKEAATS